jgi:hypothetical protein
MTFDQGDGLVTFEVVDAIHLTGDAVQDYAEDPGSLDRFFDTGVQPGKHETFMIFCGSNGIQVANPLDFFNDRYILRLQVAPEDATGG